MGCPTETTKNAYDDIDNHIASNSVTMYKHIISNHIKYQKKKAPNKPLPILLSPKNSKNEHQIMPYIHRKSNTQTTTISEVAVNLSLPRSDKGSPLQQNGVSNICSPMGEVQLSPISERDSSLIPKPMELIALSDDNKDIINEWGKSIASHTESDEEEEKLSNVVNMRSQQFSNQFSSVGYMKAFDENQSDNLSFTSSETSMSHRGKVKECVVDRKQSLGDVSYCSDNTMMLRDIDISLKSTKHRRVGSLIKSSRHFTQQSTETLSGCDIIQSPVNILSGVFNINDGFDQNEERYPQKSK